MKLAMMARIKRCISPFEAVLHVTPERSLYAFSCPKKREKKVIVPERQPLGDIFSRRTLMHLFRFSSALPMGLALLTSPALGAGWQRFEIPSTGTRCRNAGIYLYRRSRAAGWGSWSTLLHVGSPCGLDCAVYRKSGRCLTFGFPGKT